MISINQFPMATEAGLPNFWSMTNDGWWMINDGWSTINDQWWTDVCHRTGSGDRRCWITNTAWQYSSSVSNPTIYSWSTYSYSTDKWLPCRDGEVDINQFVCLIDCCILWLTNFRIAPRHELERLILYILLASGVSWYQNCWPYFGSFRLQFIQIEVLVSALCSETKKTNLDYSIVAKRPSKGSGRIWVSKELYNKLPPLILLKRFTRFFEHAFQQWEPVEWWQLSSKSTRFGFLSK